MADGEDPTLDVQVNVRADTRGAREAKAALQDIGRTATQSAAEFDRASMRHGSAFGRIITGSRNLSAAMNGVTNIMKGGIFSVGGFAQALNSLLNVVRAAAVASGPFAILALVVGTVIGVMRGLIRTTNEAARQMTGAGKSTDEFKTRLRELKEASKEAMEAVQEDARKTQERYSELTRIMGEAVNRMKEINSAQKEQEAARLSSGEAAELARATTPDERQRIQDKYRVARTAMESKYSAASLVGERLNAGIAGQAAQATLSDISAREFPFVNAAQTSAARAAQLKEEAQAAYKKYLDANVIPGGGLTAVRAGLGVALVQEEDPIVERRGRESMSAARVAILASKEAKDAEALLEKFRAENAKTREEARRNLATAGTKQEVVPIQETTEKIKLEAAMAAERVLFDQRRKEIESGGQAEAQRINAELATLRSQSGFTSNSFNNPELARQIAALEQAAAAQTTVIANAVNKLGDSYRANQRQLQKLNSQSDAARSYTTGQ